MLCLAKLDHRLRPFLIRRFGANFNTKIYSAFRTNFVNSLAKMEISLDSADFKPTEFCGLKFRNDLGNAAGLDKDGSLLKFNYQLGAGFAVIGTVLHKPHTGNPMRAFGKDCNPWIPLANSRSALNSLGLPSLGIDSTIATIKKFRQENEIKDFPIGISIMGHPLDEGQAKLDGILTAVEKSLPVVDFIEINESCPNVSHNSNDQEAFIQRVEAIAKLANKELPVLVKFGAVNNEDTYQILADNNYAGLILTNTQKDYPKYMDKLSPKDRKAFDFYTGKYQGGLSGEIIRESSLESIKSAATIIKEKNYKLELIHVGGISNKEHIAESRQYAGLREWYTGMMEAICSQDLREVYKNMCTP